MKCQAWIVGLLLVVGCESPAPVSTGPPDGYVPQAELDALQERFDNLLVEHQSRLEQAKSLRGLEIEKDKLEKENEELRATLKIVGARAEQAEGEIAKRDQDRLEWKVVNLQLKRAKLITELKNKEIIQKIATPGNDPRVYVLPAFFRLTFDQKQSFVSVCMAFELKSLEDAELQPGQVMWVYDAMNNKRVGSFDHTGLHLD